MKRLNLLLIASGCSIALGIAALRALSAPSSEAASQSPEMARVAQERQSKVRKDYAAARTALAANDRDGAILHLRHALTVEPGSAFVLQDLGRELEAAHRPREAYEAYRQVIHSDRSVSTFQRDPKFLVPYAELAERLGDSAEAAEAYGTVLRLYRPRPVLPLHPAWNVADPKGSAAAGREWVRRSQDDHLRLDLTKVTDPAERMAWVKIAQGAGHGVTMDFESALPCLQEAVRRAPRLAIARYHLGNCLRHVGRIRESEAQLREAARFGDPTLRAVALNGIRKP